MEIKQKCAASGLSEKEAMAFYEKKRMGDPLKKIPGMSPEVAKRVWVRANERSLSAIAGDYRIGIISYHKQGKPIMDKGTAYADKKAIMELGKEADRVSNPARRWVHECSLLVDTGVDTVVVQADVWDDPAQETENPLLAISDKLHTGVVLDAKGAGYVPAGNKLAIAKATLTPIPENQWPAEMEKLVKKAKPMDFAQAPSKLDTTQIYQGLVESCKVVNNKDGKGQTVFLGIAPVVEGPFKGVEFAQWPERDADGNLQHVDPDATANAFEGQVKTFVAKCWEKDGQIKGSLYYI